MGLIYKQKRKTKREVERRALVEMSGILDDDDSSSDSLPQSESSSSITNDYPYAKLLKNEFQEEKKREEEAPASVSEPAPKPEPARTNAAWMLMSKLSDAALLFMCLAWLRRAEHKPSPAVATLAVVGYLGYKTVKSIFSLPEQDPTQKRHIDLSKEKSIGSSPS